MIDYDGRRFRPIEDGRPGETRATYRQSGDLLWGEFGGGSIRRGSLTGLRRDDDTIEFTYTMVRDDGSIISGWCQSMPEVLPDGRIRLHERWERYGANAATGTSELEEI